MNTQAHRTLGAIVKQTDQLAAVRKNDLRFGDRVVVTTCNSTYSIHGNRLMVVPVESAPGFTSGTPEVVFEGAYFSPPWYSRVTARTYDISPDGKRFLMIKELDEKTESIGPPKQLHLILNWFEELKRLAPTN